MLTTSTENTGQNIPPPQTLSANEQKETISINPADSKIDKPVVVDVDVKEKQKSDKITLNFTKGNKVSEFIKKTPEAEVINKQQPSIDRPFDPNQQLQHDIKTLNSIDDEVKKFQSHVTTDAEFLDMAEMLLLAIDWLLGFVLARATGDPKAKASEYEADTAKINKLKPYVAKWLMNIKYKFPMWFFMALLFISAYRPPVIKCLDKRKEMDEKKAAEKKRKDEEAEQQKAQENIKQVKTATVQQKPVVVQQQISETEIDKVREIFVPKPPQIIEPEKKITRMNVRDMIKNKANDNNDGEQAGTRKVVVPDKKKRTGGVPVIPKTGKKLNEE